jgi:hypothetical protein
MTDLSPAAQAVFWEFNSAFDWVQDAVPGPQYKAIAAALRAAADQVVPDQQEPASSPHMGNFITNARWRQCQAIRNQLLALATELEPSNYALDSLTE